MKKLLFVFPIVALLAAGCNSTSQQTSQKIDPMLLQKESTFYNFYINQCNLTSTADWKTLTDSRNGYTTTFKYPKCWNLWSNPVSDRWSDYFLVRTDYASNPQGSNFVSDQPPLLPPFAEISPGLFLTDPAAVQRYKQSNFDNITKQTPVIISGYSGTLTELIYDHTQCEQLFNSLNTKGKLTQANIAAKCQLGNNTVVLNIADQKTGYNILGLSIKYNSTDSFDYEGLMNKIISTMSVTFNGNRDMHSHQ